jgi:hypothetical protein
VKAAPKIEKTRQSRAGLLFHKQFANEKITGKGFFQT